MRRPAVVAPLAAAARRHTGLLVVLAVACLLRLLVAVAYRPALFVGDSWSYVTGAYTGSPVSALPDRPSGYPLFIDVVGSVWNSLALLTTVQHLLGLAVGVLVYVILLRLGSRRWLATAAAAIVLLDGFAIGLEQYVMPETLSALLLTGSAALALWRPREVSALAASGLLLAGAVTVRSSALFAVPVWLAYVAWSARPARAAVAALFVIVPLLGYCAWYQGQTGTFGLTNSEGWFLYGRVGKFADCGDAAIPRGARRLCNRNERDRREGPIYHIWSKFSPPTRTFGYFGTLSRAEHDRVNRLLEQFAIAIIRDRPGTYAKTVAEDFFSFFAPGVNPPKGADAAIGLPRPGDPVSVNEPLRDSVYPSYRQRARSPSALARAYVSAIHTPRWLMAMFALAALAVLAAGLLPRGRGAFPRRRPAFLLAGMPLAILLGSAATSVFLVRYLVPVAPLLTCAGVVALEDLWALRRRRAPAISAERRPPADRTLVAAGEVPR
jgi:hypothetical protein